MNKKNKINSYVATGVLFVLLSIATYDYFQNDVANTLTRNINLRTTTDTLSFRTSGDIYLSEAAIYIISINR